ncbi:hypothetical protein Tsubulata_006637 [Turnera subulata]|uniref:4-coumarate--CoA ligase n=1 Tax=Turnera subulata TaxID=218843 RepID=A0A9Q0J4M5_9ROSI|nr:hypothetical protein Tsubulata_006637 [Turnera subulata]
MSQAEAVTPKLRDTLNPPPNHPPDSSHWYSPETGIYSSTHPTIPLPPDPFLDTVSFIFSQTHHNHNGHSTALLDSSSALSISYPALFSLVKSMASGLHHRMGIRQGDVVLLLLPNSIHFPVVFLGALYLGAVVSPLNPLSSEPEIAKLVRQTNPRLAFTTPENAPKFQSSSKNNNNSNSKANIPLVCVPEHANLDETSPKFEAFLKLVHSNADLAPRPVIRQQDTAAILCSSGTTGASKCVVLTHANLISTIELFAKFEASQYEYPSSKNVYLAALPMFHIYGLSLFVTGLLSLGSAVVVMKRFDANEVGKAIQKYGVTHFPVAPPMLMALTQLARRLPAPQDTFKSLKQVSCGAAPLSDNAIQEFVQALPHVDFIQGYGLTESAAVGTRGFNTKSCRKYSSIGLLAPNTQAKVVDWITGSSKPPGGIGELWMRCPGVMKGYLDNKEATELTVDKDGWLHTGDIVRIDHDGYLYVFDRLKEMIKYKGFQIAPADLEAILISHPEIVDAAVTGAPDKECGEIPVAFVVKKHESMLTQAAVYDFVAKQVAPYKKVRKVVFTQSIPKSPAGKILRRELRQSLMSSRL